MSESRSRDRRRPSRDREHTRDQTRDQGPDHTREHGRGHTENAVRQTRAARKELTRQRLLDVTLHLIEERSLASISLREVAREAGIVPTAFYRHFSSMDELGVELVDESMRPLRQMMREARRGRVASGDIIAETVEALARHVREHPDHFRFLTRERYGGVASVRRSIATELRLFTSDLTVDLSRLTAGYEWTTDDLEMTAGLMVGTMLGTVMDLLESDDRHPEDSAVILDRAERQLRLIVLGMGAWRSKP